jgi:hypothetical protein
MPPARFTDDDLIHAARLDAESGRVPTGHSIGRRLGALPRTVSGRVARLAASGRWPFPRDVRAGHGPYGSGWEPRTRA